MDSNSPIDWGNIARLAELDNSDTPQVVQDALWKEDGLDYGDESDYAENDEEQPTAKADKVKDFSKSQFQFPPPDERPERPLQPGQFNRFGR